MGVPSRPLEGTLLPSLSPPALRWQSPCSSTRAALWDGLKVRRQTGGLRAPGGGQVRTPFTDSPAWSPESPFPSVQRSWTRVNLPVLGAGWDAVLRWLFPAPSSMALVTLFHHQSPAWFSWKPTTALPTSSLLSTSALNTHNPHFGPLFNLR